MVKKKLVKSAQSDQNPESVQFDSPCVSQIVCLVSYFYHLPMIPSGSIIGTHQSPVCTVAILLVTATIASQKTLRVPLLIYKLFTIIGWVRLSVKVTLFH